MKAIVYYRNSKEYYFDPSQIMFFEADDDYTYAHTAKHLYRVKYRLYELEKILPDYYTRASKSGLANIRHVLAFSTTVGTTGRVEFYGSLKTLHVSRNNIKTLRLALSERRAK
ncbi:MAG: LytTR family DNA-binding domain-containing protein [Candidatus Saccharimonadales bacterium]